MAEARASDGEISPGADRTEDGNEVKRSLLPKQQSLVLYSQAALSPTKTTSSAKKGRKPRTIVVQRAGDSADSSTSARRPLLKQERRISTGDRIAMFFSRGHRETPTPDIIISGSVDEAQEDDDEDDGARTPLPVLPVILPEGDSDDERGLASPSSSSSPRDKVSKVPKFLKVTKRYRRSSLVRMDAVQKARDSLKGPEEDVYRRISVHGSLDLKKHTLLKDMTGFRNALSFSAVEQQKEDDDDTIAITELRSSSGGPNTLEIPKEGFERHRRKGSKKKRPSLRRLLTIAAEPKLNREELEERHNSRRKEREERRKERKERREREKQRLEEQKYDEEGVSISCDC